MESFATGKIDAMTMTNGDTLVTGATGVKGVMVMLTDYSNGNDMIIGRPGVRTIKDLKGKKVAVEFGLVEHLLLLNGLKKAGMKESDVTLVNAKTNEMPQVLAVNPTSLAARRADWQKVVGVWDKVVSFINDPKTQPEALKIMAARVGVKPEAYAQFLKGTRLLSLKEGQAIMVKGEGFKSLYGSTKIADEFNVANDVYKTPQAIDSYIDPSLTNAAVK
ncbi:MAG: ABC transporter substrate-binding protein [Aquabacterium sp.]